MVLVETALLVDDGGDVAASPSPTQPCIDLVENYVFWNHPEKGEKKEMSSQFDFVYDFRRPAPGSDAVGGAPTHTAADVHAELVPPLLQSLWHGNGNFATVIVHGRDDGAPSFGASPPAGSASDACKALCAEVLRAVFEADALDEAEGDDDDDGDGDGDGVGDGDGGAESKAGKEGKEDKEGKEGKEGSDAVATSPSMQLRARAAEHEGEGSVKEGEGGDAAASSAAPLPALEEVTVEMSAMDLAHGEVWDVSVYCIDPRGRLPDLPVLGPSRQGTSSLISLPLTIPRLAPLVVRRPTLTLPARLAHQQLLLSKATSKPREVKFVKDVAVVVDLTKTPVATAEAAWAAAQEAMTRDPPHHKARGHTCLEFHIAKGGRTHTLRIFELVSPPVGSAAGTDLATLNRVMTALANNQRHDKKPSRVPWRETPLTMLLSECLAPSRSADGSVVLFVGTADARSKSAHQSLVTMRRNNAGRKFSSSAVAWSRACASARQKQRRPEVSDLVQTASKALVAAFDPLHKMSEQEDLRTIIAEAKLLLEECKAVSNNRPTPDLLRRVEKICNLAVVSNVRGMDPYTTALLNVVATCEAELAALQGELDSFKDARRARLFGAKQRALASVTEMVRKRLLPPLDGGGVRVFVRARPFVHAYELQLYEEGGNTDYHQYADEMLAAAGKTGAGVGAGAGEGGEGGDAGGEAAEGGGGGEGVDSSSTSTLLPPPWQTWPRVSRALSQDAETGVVTVLDPGFNPWARAGTEHTYGPLDGYFDLSSAAGAAPFAGDGAATGSGLWGAGDNGGETGRKDLDLDGGMWEAVGKGLLHNLWSGYGAVLVSVGQVGSGKTTACVGSGDDLEGQPGLVLRIAQELFLRTTMMDHYEKGTEGTESMGIHLRVYELYMDKAYDLLDEKRRYLEEEDVGAPKAAQVECGDMAVFVSTLSAALGRRKVEATSGPEGEIAGFKSSRGQVVVEVTLRRVRQFEVVLDNTVNHGIGDAVWEEHKEMRRETNDTKLTYVEVAGFINKKTTFDKHRQNKTKAEESCNRECMQSLTEVFTALCANSNDRGLTSRDAEVVNYDASILTRSLSTTFNGHTQVALVCCVSPTNLDFDATSQTLKIADFIKHECDIVNTKVIAHAERAVQKFHSNIGRQEAERGGGGEEGGGEGAGEGADGGEGGGVGSAGGSAGGSGGGGGMVPTPPQGGGAATAVRAQQSPLVSRVAS